MRAFISGLHSGPNPSPGIGTAKSLRFAYPKAVLIGVDYSLSSSGIHCADFDELWLQRPWNELDLSLYRDQILQAMGDDSVWISGLDLEAQWLAENHAQNKRILVPPSQALEQTSKPEVAAVRSLPVTIPPYISADRPSWELHAFCRKHGWPIWCKGPNYEARQAGDWKEVVEALGDIRKVWSTPAPSLQAHVVGWEESIAFCAYEGELLDCVYMTKRLQTKEGKTWSGRISDVEPALRAALCKLVAELEWTGGGELEFVRDRNDALHLIDWNPRFPAWLYGATLAGHNLPARLLEAAGFGKPEETSCVSQEFSRIVTEIPVRAGYALPPLAASASEKKGLVGKHPSGMPLLAKKLSGKAAKQLSSPPSIPECILQDLSNLEFDRIATPQRIFLEQTARRQFSTVQALLDEHKELQDMVYFAYSMKTSPHPRLLQLTLDHGFYIEVINELELKRALECGFSPERIIVNGPAQLWPNNSALSLPLCAIFADSLHQLERLVDSKPGAKYVGVRLRPVGAESRFGVDMEEFDSYCRLVELLRQSDVQALGLHFHVQSDVTGVGSWWEIYESMLNYGESLQESVGRSIQCLDVGGGWHPEDFATEFLPQLPETVAEVRKRLPDLKTFLIEPGRAFAQPSMALVTRVLEVRQVKNSDGNEIVVDGATSELPLASSYPHRILVYDRENQELMTLADGEDRILGRHCMESDILCSGVQMPENILNKDILVFCDAGAYDWSVSYDFAMGT